MDSLSFDIYNQVRKYSDFLVYFCLSNDQFLNMSYSKIAISAVIASRKACKLNPVWNPIFEELTSIKYN